MKKLILFYAAMFFGIELAPAQYVFKDDYYNPTGLSNEGKVAGYQAQGGPYSFWLPDSGNVIVDIGGVAPGMGVGGQAHFSTDGNLVSGTSMGLNGPEMSKYNRLLNQWTLQGSLGFSVDGNFSGGFTISGDGNTVAGLSWTDTTTGNAYVHAVANSVAEGFMDLGSLYDSLERSTRANAISYDGSVIVGWQDFNGPWKSAVWRKNPAGGYYPNEYILLDTTLSAFDEYNQMGECSVVSADGIWIGGYGDYANNNEPWIWSQDSGVINLGTLPNVGTGYVSGINANGTVVVGWFDGQLWGDPQTPFIWTSTGGLYELNSYINNVLGLSTGSHIPSTAYCISPDGHYVAGYGVDNVTFNLFVYRVSLLTTGINETNEISSLKIYPNPAVGIVTIENNKTALISISSVEGKIVYKNKVSGNLNLDVSEFPSGVYSVTLQSEDSIRTQKLVKK